MIVCGAVGPLGAPLGASSSSRSGAKLPSVPAAYERVAGAAVGLKEGLAGLQVRRHLLLAGRRVAPRAKGEPGDADREEHDKQPEDDEGAFAHLAVFGAGPPGQSRRPAAGILLAPRRSLRYQGHIRRSPQLCAARLRAADLAPVADQVHVQLVGVLGVDDRQHLLVGLLQRGAWRKRPSRAADAMDVDVDGELRECPS